MKNGDSDGLSSENRKYLVALSFLILLIWGPIDDLGMVALAIYLTAIPTALWFALRYVGTRLQIDRITNDRIYRALTTCVGCALLVAAYHSFTAESHIECTQYVRTVDRSMECAGDEMRVPGADNATGAMLIFFAALAFWSAVSRDDT